MFHRTRIAVVVLSLAGCAGASDSPPPTAAASAPAPAPTSTTPRPVLPAAGVSVTSPACGYGGSAPGVSVFVDVTTSIALTGVTMSFALTDPSTGAARGRSGDPQTIVVSPPERGLLDFSTQGTVPFTGSLAPGTTTRLEYFAALVEDPAAAIPAGALGGPLRVNVVIDSNEGIYTAVCDTAQMWPSS